MNATRKPDSLDWLKETVEGGESIMGRLIRERNERRARAIALAMRVRRAWTVASLILLPLAMLIGLEAGKALAAYYLIP